MSADRLPSPNLLATTRAVMADHPVREGERYRVVHLHRSDLSSTAVATILPARDFDHTCTRFTTR